MHNGRLLGPLLLLAGGIALALPETLEQQAGLPLTSEEIGYGSQALATLGLLLALQGWRAGLIRASFSGWAALRQATGRSAGIGPAKRMKIRIRCAR